MEKSVTDSRGKKATADYGRQFAFIDRCTDASSLRTLIKRAKEKGVPSLGDAAFKKLISLVPEARPGSVEHDFWTMIHAFEEVLTEERAKTTRLSRTRQKEKRVGVVRTLQDWAVGSKTEGFDMLIVRGLPELSGEAIVLRHPALFGESVQEAARKRLREAGVDVGALPPGGPLNAPEADAG